MFTDTDTTETSTTATARRPLIRIENEVARGEVLYVVASPEGVPAYETSYALAGEKVRDREWVHYSLFADDDAVTVGIDETGPYVATERGTLRGAPGFHRGVLITQEGVTHREWRDGRGYTRKVEAA